MADLKPAPSGYPIKLVRDHTADVINATGEPGDLWYAPAPGEDVERFLRLKLAEEVGEYLLGGAADELADVYDVVLALGYHAKVDLARMAQLHPRGGFYDAVMMYGRHDEFDRAASVVCQPPGEADET